VLHNPLTNEAASNLWPPRCLFVADEVRVMKILFVFLCLIMLAVPSVSGQTSNTLNPVGRWQVKFTVIDTAEKNLVFTAQEGGDGSFQLLDTAPNNKPDPNLHAAAWSLAKGNLSISGEVEIQTGSCCRETGTLILKAKFTSNDSMSGKLIFVTNIDEEEGPYKYHATVGTFSAKRLAK
jgi:hypothetical protein